MPKNLLFVIVMIHLIVEHYIGLDSLDHNSLQAALSRFFAYFLVFSGYGWYMQSLQIALIGLWITVICLGLDCLRIFSHKHYRQNGYYMFVQFAKLAVIFSLLKILPISDIGSLRKEIIIGGMSLVLALPTASLIRAALWRYRPEEQNSVPNAGKFVGILERWIILYMLIVQEFSAIGFVLVAKSVARYERISKETRFAEYYLLGTLLSTLLVLVIYSIFYIVYLR